MKQMNFRVFSNGQWSDVEAKPESSLLGALRENGFTIQSPCGGNGTCGKCKVQLQSGAAGAAEELFENEKRHLSSSEIAAGTRLSCMIKVQEGMQVIIPQQAAAAQIQTEGKSGVYNLKPVVSKKYLKLQEPSLEDQSPDLDRILKGLGRENLKAGLELLKKLPGLMRSSGYTVTIAMDEGADEILGIEEGDQAQQAWGIAVDIGTTTVVAYLLNLNTGARKDAASMLNPQRSFGGDVISRINHTIQNESGLGELQNIIADGINKLIQTLCKKNNISNNEIYNITFAGNTTMMHILAGLSPANIAVSPFIPVTTSLCRIKAAMLGIGIHPEGYAVIIPSVSGYVGADTVAAVLASGMHMSDDICLLVDIGTNGEIVLGSKKGMYACSTAAGPAFEGAHIRNGIGGVAGAINTITVEENKLKFTTIGNREAVGVCGSGIIDAVSAFLSVGLLDETGRLLDKEEMDSSLEGIIERVVEIENMSGVLIDKNIIITQKDIREVQLAKAAIAAGIKILAKSAGIELDDIKKVYLAGGFGSYIDKKSAVKIGLIPGKLDGKLESLGNAAGEGAVMCLLSKDSLTEAEAVSKSIEYIELSSYSDFQNEFVECMMFE